MKILSSSILLIIILIFGSYSTDVFASAAEKWDYDVKPDTNQKIKLTGHKVDQYGNAANDYQYKTTIDPKTAANRTKMGTVAINKLLKRANWALLGVTAFQSFLEGLDWVIDPASQSIWREKEDSSATPDCGFGHIFRYQTSQFRQCPIDAVKEQLAKWETSTVRYEFKSWDVNISSAIRNKERILFTVTQITSHGSTHMPNQNLEYKVDPNAVPREKEFLTPEAAADYANHTHPDFTNPKYAPRAEPLYKPEMQTELWKPHNPWEYENSPTVEEAKKELEKAKPEPKDEEIKENEPNPETGQKSFSLPAFCSWAVSVCEFIDWMKEKPEQEQEQQQPDINDQGIFNKKFDTNFSLSKQCPPDIPVSFQSTYINGSYTISMSWLCMIFTFLGYPIVFLSHCVGIWILYEASISKQLNR